MSNNIRKSCVNTQLYTYTGKENSPLHFGLSAEGYEPNTVMKGFDNLFWIVKYKNNRKVWVRKDDSIDNDIIEQKIDNINPEVLKDELPVNKKKTDYILYLSYRLNQLNEENKDKKNNFNLVVKEWKSLKNNKADLAKKMEEVHKWNNTL
jgi:hypothetical protein